MLVFFVRESLGGGNGDAVPGMDPHRVEIFNGTDDDHVVLEIPHHFQLIFPPAEHGFLDENLADHAGLKAPRRQFLEFLDIECDGTSCASEGKAGANDGGKSDLSDNVKGLFHAVSETALGKVEADCVHRLLESPPVFSLFDGLVIGPDHLHPVLVQDTLFEHLNGHIEPCLSTQSWEEGVRPLTRYDLLNHFGGDGFDVGPVGHLGIGHDGGGIAVYQDDFKPLLLEGLTGLGS